MQRSRFRIPTRRHFAAAVMCTVLFFGFMPASYSLHAVQQGADPGEQLRAAASRGEIDALRALLESGSVDVNAANEYGATALILACNNSRTEAVRVLLEAGADPDLADTFYELTPLAWAARANSEEIVALLFQSGAAGFDVLFQNAVAAGDLERVAYLASLNMPPDELLSSALAAANASGNTEMVDLLERMGALPPPPEKFDIAEDQLTLLEGVYADEVGYQLEVTTDLADRVLLIKPLGMRTPLRFFAASPTLFISEQATNVFAEFVVRDGRVSMMTFTQAGSRRRLVKQ